MWQTARVIFEWVMCVFGPGLRQFAPWVKCSYAPTTPPLTCWLFLDFHAFFSSSGPSFFFVSTIRQVIWPSLGTLMPIYLDLMPIFSISCPSISISCPSISISCPSSLSHAHLSTYPFTTMKWDKKLKKIHRNGNSNPVPFVAISYISDNIQWYISDYIQWYISDYIQP